MEERARTLIADFTRIYREIRACSDWEQLKSARDIDQVRALLDRRAALLAKAAALPPLSSIEPAALSLPLRQQYAVLVSLIREITDADQWVMGKINGRMAEIREELKAKNLFRSKAIPGYLRQKFAIAS